MSVKLFMNDFSLPRKIKSKLVLIIHISKDGLLFNVNRVQFDVAEIN